MARITCRNCPCKKELANATRLLEHANIEMEARLFQTACLSLLQYYGFHVNNKNDALACIRELCLSVNHIETIQSHGVQNES
jgi:hypothetical protein